MIQDVRGMYLSPGMYIVYAAEYADSLEQRIAKILAIKESESKYGDNHEYLSVRSVRRRYIAPEYHYKAWELNNDGKAHAIKNMDGVFAIAPSHVPDEVRSLLD